MMTTEINQQLNLMKPNRTKKKMNEFVDTMNVTLINGWLSDFGNSDENVYDLSHNIREATSESEEYIINQVRVNRNLVRSILNTNGCIPRELVTEYLSALDERLYGI